MKILLLLAAMMLALISCGPEQTAQDKDKQQLDALIAEGVATYEPLRGTYVGKLTSDTSICPE